MASINIVKGTCRVCKEEFTYVRYKVDKNYCSSKCRSRAYYVERGTYSQRKRRTKMEPEEWKEHKSEYDKAYRKRPDVRERIRARQRLVYSTEAYRAYSRDRYYRLYSGVHPNLPDLNHGYVGPAFDHVREIVGKPPRQDSVFFDDWAERMGTAILAQAEGRDIHEALKEYRRGEFIPKYRTTYLGEYHNDDDRFRLDKILATEDLTEKEALAKIAASETTARAPVVRMGSNTNGYGKGYNKSRTRPTRRRGFKPWQDRPGHRRAR